MRFQSNSEAWRRPSPRRAPLTIDAVAEPAPDEAPASPRAKKRVRRHYFWRGAFARGRHLLDMADRHAIPLASLTLALGVGWIIGANMFHDGGANTREFARALAQINARVEALAAALPQKSDVAEIAALKRTLETSRVRTSETLAQLKDKVERAPQLQTVLQRVANVERRLDEAPKAQPQQVTQVTSVPVSEPDIRVPLAPSSNVRAGIPANGYVLRQASAGLAYIESRDGVHAVSPGHILPGAGRVQSIEKRGQKWIVVTSAGVIDSDLY